MQQYINKVISTAIIEDIGSIREGIAEFLKIQPNILCEIQAASVEEFLHANQPAQDIEVLLLDIGLPGMSGISGIKFIKEMYPDINIIMLTVYEDPDKIFEALCAGATGYLVKNTPLPKIKESIEEVINGGAPMTPHIARKVLNSFSTNVKQKKKETLTPKEKEIVAGLTDGLSYKMIA
ncbi:MAG TPA: response regulator transcription factor, partial [Bacteroidales bacterium]|nr:response regulator transcription factor [Bacteroidales bacterium]